MRKRVLFLSGIAVITLCVITTIKFNLKNKEQDIILSNIEALAKIEYDYNNGAAEKNNRYHPKSTNLPSGSRWIKNYRNSLCLY